MGALSALVESFGWAGFVDPHLGPAVVRLRETPGVRWSGASIGGSG